VSPITSAIDSKCKKFALKSRCTPFDSTKKLTTFHEINSGEFHIIFFDYYSRFDCCEDRGLHFYTNDIRNRNVYLPVDSKCIKFALKSHCTIPRFNFKFKSFKESYSNEFYTAICLSFI